jgi:hypothetical protein
VRRYVAVLAAVLAIAGTPLVARALDDDVVEASPRASSPFAVRLAAPPVAATPVPDVALPDVALPELAPIEPELAPIEPAPVVDPVTALLIATYTFGESGPRVVALQEALEVTADGGYSFATLSAHRAMLDYFDLPTTGLPEPILPAGPSAEEWAALRACESNGNYAITNPSGKYRGAYQFDRSTWNSVGERHAPQLVGVDPAAASPADQDLMALALYSERGARPWPHCGRHLS